MNAPIETAKAVPVTPLPWDVLSDSSGVFLYGAGGEQRDIADFMGNGQWQNACYAMHAANAYPKLVAVLLTAYHKNQWVDAVHLLRELGELK